MTNSYIISQYPLTSHYIDQFSDMVGERPEPLILSNISAGGSICTIRFLTCLKAETLYLPETNGSGASLIPILKCLSLLIRVKKRVLVKADFSIRSFNTFEGMRELFGLGLGFLAGIQYLLHYWLMLRSLRTFVPTSFSGVQKKKILYLKTNLSLGVQVGGAIAHTNGVVSSFLSKNFEIDYASTEPPNGLPDDERLKYLPLEPLYRYVIPRDINYFSHSVRLFTQIIKKITCSYDFIYQRHSLGNLTGVRTSRYLSLPLVLEYNGPETWLAANWGRPLFFNKMAMQAEDVCLKNASLIVTVSDVLRDELINRGVQPERIVTCPNGVNPDIFDVQNFSEQQIEDLRKRHGIMQDAVVATFVGTFGHWHGVEELAQTLRLMVSENREWLEQQKLHFLFVGDGAKREMVETILSDPELRSFYTLTGLVPQNDAPLYMAASNILISPHVPNSDGSPFFGSPTKLFEYMSTGRPVIASNLFQIGEILEGSPTISERIDFTRLPEDSVCGILVRPNSPEELSLAVQALVENPDWGIQTGLNARKRAIDKYTWDHHTDSILKKAALN